jgi:arylsulfatase A-like enzyme
MNLRNASALELIVAAMAGAGLSLALAGLGESCYVSPMDLAAGWYAFSLYSLGGMISGLVWAVLFGGRARRVDYGVLHLAGTAAALPTFFLVLAAAGFLVYRDLLAEAWPQDTNGWLGLALVFIGAVLAASIARGLGRSLARRAKTLLIVLLGLSLSGVFFARDVEEAFAVRYDFAPAKEGDARAPIIFVTIDALRTDRLGAYGSSLGLTPHLDSFAEEAVTYTQAHSTSTWTRPAVASILTGQYASTHKTMHKSDRLPQGLKTLAEILTQDGYASLASVTNVNLSPIFGLGRGFEAWGYLAPRPYLSAPTSARRLFVVEIYRLLKLRFFPGDRQVSSYYAEGERVSRQGLSLIAQATQANRPFFAYLHYMEPHDPYFAHPYNGQAMARVENPRPNLDQKDQLLDLYHQEVRHVDGLVGNLLKQWKKENLYDPAMIVITADHGEEFADHGHFWHGTSLYQELLHVPLLIKYPKGAGRGSAVHTPVSLVDLAPTALGIAGLKDQDLAGRDLGILFASQAAAEKTKDQNPDLAAESPPEPDKTPLRPVFAELDHQGCHLAAIRVGPWKLIKANENNPRNLAPVALYNLSKDPLESTDQAEKESQQTSKLSVILKTGPGQKTKIQTPGKATVDPATEEQLRSLGYTE